MRFLNCLSLLAMLVSSALAQEQTRKLELGAEGIKYVEVDCGSGFLRVQGVENLASIEVQAEIIVRGLRNRDFEEFINDNLELTLERRRDTAVLIARFDNHSRSYFRRWRRFERHVDLTVRVPRQMNLYIDDGSGHMEVEKIRGEVRIDDGSGEMYVGGIEGSLDIDDGSGDLHIEDIAGNTRIDDSSGGIDAVSIQGDLDIDDSSGGIYARDILGSVIIGDGSGSIDIRGVEKDVVIREDGSGSVSLHDVKGRVTRRDW